MDYTTARRNMVACQIRPNNVTDERVLETMGTLPRERFLPKPRQPFAYVDDSIEIAPDRFMMDPSNCARLVQAAAIESDDNILVVGSGTGYLAACAGQIGGSVFALESDSDLAERMTALLTEIAQDNVVAVSGVHSEGWADEAPYDVILIEGAVPTVPQNILDQMAEGGRLVAVVGAVGQIGRLTLFVKRNDVVSKRVLFDAMTKPAAGFEQEVAFVF